MWNATLKIAFDYSLSPQGCYGFRKGNCISYCGSRNEEYLNPHGILKFNF